MRLAKDGGYPGVAALVTRDVLTADTYTSVLPTLARQSAEATARLVLDAARTTATLLRTPRRRHRASPAAP